MNPATRGRLLVDDTRHAHNWQLWLDLLRFRQRHYGVESIKPMFEQIVQRGLEMPTEGSLAQELWVRIVQAGNQDHDLLELVTQYASRLLRFTGRSWPRLYMTIMATILDKDMQTVMYWHRRLHSDFSPTTGDYQKIFRLTLKMGSLDIFENMYNSHPPQSMYATVVPELCNLRMYEQACHWHFVLMKAKDLPVEFLALEPLLTYYAKLKDDRRVEAIAMSVLDQGREIQGPLRKFVAESNFISREIMNRQLAEVHGIARKHFSDHFCARLFATKIFSVDTVINGLAMTGSQVLGHKSLREMVSRDDCQCDVVCRHFDRLKEAGIFLNKSKYSTVIRQAALGNKRWLLRSIVDCDAHPDTFEDVNLQEELFTMYLDRGDTTQMQRTLATITAEVPEETLEMQRQNVILRGHMRLHNRAKVISMLENMKSTNIPLTPKSSRHLRVQWLTKRRVGMTGQTHLTLKDLRLVISVMKLTLESGAAMPPDAWREILRRLGMTGQLREFSSLALWLADRYANLAPTPDSGASIQRSFNRIAAQRHLGSTVSNSSPSLPTLPLPPALQSPATKNQELYHNNDYLTQLFTKSGQQAILAWGFQEEAKRPLGLGTKAYDHDQRPMWTWGLLLLRQLRERGVPIHRGTVAKACEQRLAQLFGMRGRSTRKANRRARRLNDGRLMGGNAAARYESYVREMESIWGQQLLVGLRKLVNENPALFGKQSEKGGSS